MSEFPNVQLTFQLDFKNDNLLQIKLIQFHKLARLS